jgi:hypothetical protein
VIRKSQILGAIACSTALAIAGIARADGVSENQAFVEGKVSPKKLERKRFRNINLFTGVRTQTTVDGTQANPRVELISFGKNVRFRPDKAPRCTTPLPNGATADQARAMCPRKSFLGAGRATVRFPGLEVNDVIVSVFNGPGRNELRLHTYSPTLAAGSPTVAGKIVRSPAGRKYGKALSVPNAPETGSGMITEFNAKITRSSKVVQARCKSRKFRWLRQVTYSDGSTETATLQQRCKRKPGKHRGH